jgi:type IX secretion system PorP/SprF family membrane protein
MIRKNILKAAGLSALVALAGTSAFAQDIHFTQFNAAPLTINPAFTGNFNGTVRVAGIYRNQWQSVTVPFKTYCATVDAPIVVDLAGDDFLAAGLQVYSDKAGDLNLSNTSVLASVAYHKYLGGSASGDGMPDKSLSVGFQGGYNSKSLDLSKAYFGDEFLNGVFQQGGSSEYPYLNNNVHFWTINAGIAWAHKTSDRFSYTLGVGANNLNQPAQSMKKQQNSDVGLAMRYTAQAGAIAQVSDRLRLLPVVLYQSQATATEVIIGNEFNFALANPNYSSVATAVFAGIFYRNSDAVMATVGIDFKGFRFGVGYDYNTSALKDASAGRGGFEIMLRYIAPNPFDFAGRRGYPCARF